MATINGIVETAGSVVTLSVSGTDIFAVGNVVQLQGLITGVWLNGRLVTLLKGSTNSSLIFVDPTENGPLPPSSESGKATVFTPQNPSPDELYLQTRESLLPYEDARFNSLIQSVANFYMTRNDQSTWGNCLRAIAKELSRLEYFYAYDLINKNPSFLTPPDIRRRWADPLYVSSNWPSPTQFDINFQTMLVDLIAAYRLGSTVVSIQDVIFAYTGINIVVEQLYQFIGDGFYDQSDRNAIKVSVNVGGSNPLTDIQSLTQLQAITQSLYGAIDLAKPAHVGLEFTTVFGEGEDLDCLISPTLVTQQMYNTLSTTMQGYYKLTAYVPINPVLFWKPDTSFLNPNQANGLGLVIVDSNGNLQIVTALAGNQKSGLTLPPWSEDTDGVTADGNVTWENISPSVTNVVVASNVLTVTVDNTLLPVSSVPQSVKLVGLGNALFLNGKKVLVTSTSPTEFSATFVDNSYVTQVSVVGTTLTVVCANDFQPGMTVEFSSLLFATFLNGQSGVVATSSPTQFTITGVSYTAYPLALESGTAALIDYPSTPETQGTASYFPASSITAAEYAALTSLFQGLYQAQYTNYCCPNYAPDQPCSAVPQGITDTLRIFIREFEIPPFAPMLIQAPVLGTVPAPFLPEWNEEVQNTLFGHEPTTTLAAWSYKLSAPQNATLTPAQWAALPAITFTITNAVSDGANATYTYSSLSTTAIASPPLVPPYLSLHENELVTLVGCTSGFLNGTAKIKNVTATTFQIANPNIIASAVQSGTGNVAPLLQSAYGLQYGNYVLLQAPPAPLSPYLGVSPTLSAPLVWTEIVVNDPQIPNEVNLVATGEVSNWDATHAYGLLAPRLSQVWEISGDDQFYIFGLT